MWAVFVLLLVAVAQGPTSTSAEIQHEVADMLVEEGTLDNHIEADLDLDRKKRPKPGKKKPAKKPATGGGTVPKPVKPSKKPGKKKPGKKKPGKKKPGKKPKPSTGNGSGNSTVPNPVKPGKKPAKKPGKKKPGKKPAKKPGKKPGKKPSKKPSGKPGSTCSCNGELNEDGGGECWNTMKSTGKSYCYVNEGVCQDQKKSASMSGWFWSYQACEVGSGYNPSLPGYKTTQEILGVKAIAGTNNYVEYYPGNMNLILTSPHGGKLKPFPDRVKNVTGHWGGVTFLADKYTKEIAIEVIKHIKKNTGRRPHFVVNNVYRNCLDPNRDEKVGAQNISEAITAFREYHAFIDQAKLDAVPPQLKLSSSGAASTDHKHRMGNYYLSVRRHNGFPVYAKMDNSQVVFVNDDDSWSVSTILRPTKRSLRNKETGGASPSPPVGGWEYWDSGSSRFVSDPDMKVESIAPPYVTVRSSGNAASGQPTRMGKYLNTSERHNDHPVYKKEDNSQVMFVNNKNEWVVLNTIDSSVHGLRNTAGLTATPPRDGWQFWNMDSSRWDDDSKLRVDPPSALLFDVHGHNHKKNASEIGYTLNAKQLNDSSYSAEDTSIFGLIERSGISAPQMMHGNKSLGAMFNEAGYTAFPSKNQPTPGNDSYFNGGYTLGVHGSRKSKGSNGGPIDALQVEFPSELRRPQLNAQSIRDRLFLDVAQIFQRFYVQFYDN